MKTNYLRLYHLQLSMVPAKCHAASLSKKPRVCAHTFPEPRYLSISLSVYELLHQLTLNPGCALNTGMFSYSVIPKFTF